MTVLSREYNYAREYGPYTCDACGASFVLQEGVSPLRNTKGQVVCSAKCMDTRHGAPFDEQLPQTSVKPAPLPEPETRSAALSDAEIVAAYEHRALISPRHEDAFAGRDRAVRAAEVLGKRCTELEGQLRLKNAERQLRSDLRARIEEVEEKQEKNELWGPSDEDRLCADEK